MNTWCPGVPVDYLPAQSGAPMRPSAVVEHRTIGRWAGDYSVLHRGRVPSVHFLVGQEPGQHVQFLPVNQTCAGAAGANSYTAQIEHSGQNGEPLTDWQIEASGVIHRWMRDEWGIPAVFLDDDGGHTRVSSFNGYLNHSNVATTPNYLHVNYVARAEWDRMMGGAPAPSPPPEPTRRTKHVIFILDDYKDKEAYEYVGGPTTDRQSYIRLYGAEPLVNAGRGAPVVSLRKDEFEDYVAGRDLNNNPASARGWTF